jgi:hypothetical protein
MSSEFKAAFKLMKWYFDELIFLNIKSLNNAYMLTLSLVYTE